MNIKSIAQAILFYSIIGLCGCSDKGEYIIHTCTIEKPNCVDESPSVLKVKVDKPNHKVLMTYYKNGVPNDSDILGKDFCEIFDEKNWNCKSSESSLTVFRWEYSMRDGKLTYTTQRNQLQTQLVGPNPIYRVEKSSLFNW